MLYWQLFNDYLYITSSNELKNYDIYGNHQNSLFHYENMKNIYHMNVHLCTLAEA